jgi:hypothetical protein
MANLVLIAEAAEQSSYTTQHISLLLRRKSVKGRKVGRIWLVDLDDLKRYEKEMEEMGTKKFDPTQGRDKS